MMCVCDGGRCWVSYLDGGSSEAAELLDMLTLLPNDGSHRLGRDVDVDSLLLRSLWEPHS